MAPVEKTNVVTAIVYDFETGGLDPSRCGATQISLHAVRLDTFKVMEKYDAYIYPYNKKKDLGKPKKKVLKSKYDMENEEELMDYDDVALKYSDITMNMLYSKGKQIDIVCTEICDFIQRNTLPVVASNKPIMVGQNPLFDNAFMQQIMLYTNCWDRFIKLVRGSKDFWGNFQPTHLDTILLAQLAFDHDKNFNTWKLEAIAEKFGVELDDAHNADADVTATYEVLKASAARLRSMDIGKVDGAMFSEKKEKLRDYFKI